MPPKQSASLIRVKQIATVRYYYANSRMANLEKVDITKAVEHREHSRISSGSVDWYKCGKLAFGSICQSGPSRQQFYSCIYPTDMCTLVIPEDMDKNVSKPFQQYLQVVSDTNAFPVLLKCFSVNGDAFIQCSALQ